MSTVQAMNAAGEVVSLTFTRPDGAGRDSVLWFSAAFEAAEGMAPPVISIATRDGRWVSREDVAKMKTRWSPKIDFPKFEAKGLDINVNQVIEEGAAATFGPSPEDSP